MPYQGIRHETLLQASCSSEVGMDEPSCSLAAPSAQSDGSDVNAIFSLIEASQKRLTSHSQIPRGLGTFKSEPLDSLDFRKRF